MTLLPEIKRMPSGGVGKSFIAAVFVLLLLAMTGRAEAEVLVTLDYRGDRLTRITDEPALSILDDGRIRMPQLYAHTRPYEGRLTSKELDALEQFLVDKAHALENSPRDQPMVHRRKRAGHLAATVIQLRVEGRSRLVRLAGVQKGESAAVAHQQVIKRRLEQIMTTTQLGGPEGLRTWLDIANQTLQAKFPSAAPFTAEDLEGGAHRPDGSVHVRFARIVFDEILRATIDQTANGRIYTTVARHAP